MSVSNAAARLLIMDKDNLCSRTYIQTTMERRRVLTLCFCFNL